MVGACRWPHRPSPSGGERRYLRPQIPFSRTRTLSTSVPGFEKFIAPFVARQPGNCVRKQAFHPPVTRESFRLLSLRPGHQLTAAVRADAIHARGAARTEGAFVAADARLAIKWQTGSALLARGPHFKGHVVTQGSLRSAGAGGERARTLLRGPHRCERRSPCRSLLGVAASAPAAADIGSVLTCGCSQGAADP